jgi:predicted nucleic acid-binding protein
LKGAVRKHGKPTAGEAGRTAEKLAAYFLPGTSSPAAASGGPAAGVLPDTCAWIDFFAGKATTTANFLAAALRNSPVFTCGPVLSELLQGTRGDHDRAALLEAHRSLEYAEATPAIWVRAGDLAAVLRRSGTTVPLSDLLIAAIAIEQHLEIITADRHFGLIPGVRVQG